MVCWGSFRIRILGVLTLQCCSPKPSSRILLRWSASLVLLGIVLVRCLWHRWGRSYSWCGRSSWGVFLVGCYLFSSMIGGGLVHRVAYWFLCRVLRGICRGVR